MNRCRVDSEEAVVVFCRFTPAMTCGWGAWAFAGVVTVCSFSEE